MCFRPFRYSTKLGAKLVKLVQLMQKVVPRCFVRIFCNKCSRSTPLDSKLMFWCISFHLGAFETIWLLQKTRCKMGQPGAIKAEVRATKSRQKFSKWMLPIHILDPKLMFSCVSFHLGASGTVSYHTKLKAKRAKLVQLMQKFVPWCPVRIFPNEHSRSTPLDPKLMFSCVPFRLGAFGTVSLLH